MAISNKKLIIVLLISIIVLLSILTWYCSPYAIRKFYYNNFECGVHDAIISDTNFPFTDQGFSKTYDYHNQYLMPAGVSIKLTKVNNLLPKEPRKLFKVNLKVLVETLHRGNIVRGFTNKVPFSISYAIGRHSRYRSLELFPDIPTSYLAKFRDDVKIRITILETDPVLDGCEGTLIIKPQTSW